MGSCPSVWPGNRQYSRRLVMSVPPAMFRRPLIPSACINRPLIGPLQCMQEANLSMVPCLTNPCWFTLFFEALISSLGIVTQLAIQRDDQWKFITLHGSWFKKWDGYWLGLLSGMLGSLIRRNMWLHRRSRDYEGSGFLSSTLWW